MTKVLFVCTGNVCRSPMAEGLFRKLIEGRDDIDVASAGIGALAGQPPSDHSVTVMRDLGIDIRKQRSQPVTADLVRNSDFIFVMTYGHLDSMLLLFPLAGEKTFLLREFEPGLPVLDREVSDPIGQGRGVYMACRDQIRQALPHLLSLIDAAEGGGEPTATPAKEPRRLAVSGEKAGLTTKAEVTAWLRACGHQVEDCGPFSREETENAEQFAQRVARAVACGDAEGGLILVRDAKATVLAVNRVARVKAYEVTGEPPPHLSAPPKGVNVLCFPLGALGPDRLQPLIEHWLEGSAAADI